MVVGSIAISVIDLPQGPCQSFLILSIGSINRWMHLAMLLLAIALVVLFLSTSTTPSLPLAVDNKDVIRHPHHVVQLRNIYYDLGRVT